MEISVKCINCDYVFTVNYIKQKYILTIEKWVTCPDCGCEFVVVIN